MKNIIFNTLNKDNHSLKIKGGNLEEKIERYQLINYKLFKKTY